MLPTYVLTACKRLTNKELPLSIWTLLVTRSLSAAKFLNINGVKIYEKKVKVKWYKELLFYSSSESDKYTQVDIFALLAFICFHTCVISHFGKLPEAARCVGKILLSIRAWPLSFRDFGSRGTAYIFSLNRFKLERK